MAISKEEIKHIADLSRLKLSAQEKTKFQTQLGSILDYMKQLDEVDVSGVEPTAQVTGLIDVWREDQVQEWDQTEVENALNQGKLEGGQIKVKRVL